MKVLLKTWKYYLIAGLGIIILALVLRLYNLNEVPVFGDEAIYVRWAQVMRNEPTLRFLPLSDGKQPLFMWAVIPFQKIIKDPVIAGRLVSVVTGMGTMIGIFVLTVLLFVPKRKDHFRNSNKLNTQDVPVSESIFQRILNQVQDDRNVIKKGLIAALIYAISPFTLFFDRLALVDSMLAMFGVWTFIFGLLTVRYLRFDAAMLAGFALGAARLTKSTSLFFILLLPTLLVFSKWPKSRRNKPLHLIKLTFLILTTYGISLVIYNILRLGPNFHIVAQRNLDYVHPISRLFQYPFDPLVVFLKKIFNYFWLLGPASLVLVFLASFVTNIRKQPRDILVLMTWGILPIVVVSEFSKTMTARYVLFVIPYFIIIAAAGYTSLTLKWKKSSYPGLLMIILLVVFFIQSMIINRLMLTKVEAVNLPRSERSGFLEEWTSGTGIIEVSEIIRAEYLSDHETKIVVGTEGFFGTLPDGLQAYLADVPEITVIGVGGNVTDVPMSLIESKSAGNKTYLVINSTRLLSPPSEIGLEIISEYPKEPRLEGSWDYNLHGPQETLYLFEVTADAVSINEASKSL